MRHEHLFLSSRRRRLALSALAGTSLALTSPVLAQTWTGLSATTNNWTDAANWTTLPINNGTANVIFAGTARLGPFVNSAQDVNSITFNNTAGAFVVGGSSALTIRSGGIINQDAQTQTINAPLLVAASQIWSATNGGLAFNGPSIQLNATLTINASNAAVSALASFSGSGGLIKNGSASLSLAGTNTFSGTTSVNQGLLSASSNGLSPNSPLFIGSTGSVALSSPAHTIYSLSGPTGASLDLGSGTLTINAGPDSATYPFNGIISGTGNVTKLGSHTQALAGANTYTGTTTVSAGTLRLDADERLANSSILTVSGTGVLNLQGFTETVLAVNMSGSDLGPIGSSGTLIANAFNIESGIVRVRFAGPGGLTKANAALNAVVFSSGHSYAGSTIVSGGTLSINAADALPDASPVSVRSPGILQFVNFPDTVGSIEGDGTIGLLSSTLSVGANNASTTFSGIIADQPASIGHLTKVGTGTLTLSGPNTYRGTTTLNAGVLRLSGANRLAPTSSVVINAGQFITQNESVSQVTLNAGELRGHIIGLGSIGAGTYLFNSGFCDAVLSGPGGLIKASPGIVSLRGRNSQAFTRVDAGTLSIYEDSALGQPGAGLYLNGGTLSVDAACTIDRPFGTFSASTIDCFGDVLCTNFSPFNSSTLIKAGPGRLTLAGSPFSNGPLVVNQGEVRLAREMVMPLIGGSVASGAALTVDGGVLYLIAPLTNAGRLHLAPGARIVNSTLTNNAILTGSGTIASSFSNSSAGSVRIAQDQSILFASTSPASNAGLLEVISGSLEFSSPITNAISTGLIYARDASLRFNAGLTNFGAVALSFGISDLFGDLDNRPTGTITISGASDATFVDDVVNNGILRTSAGSASVFLGALSGSGSFPGTGTVFMEGDLRPGNSPGRMTFGGDLIIGTFAGMHVEIAGTSANAFDSIDVARTIVLDGTLDVSFVNAFRPSACDTLTLIRADAVVGSFHTVNLPNNVALLYHPDRVELLLSGCPADLDDGSATGTPDCGVTVDDLLFYIDAYTLGLLRADLDDGSNTGTPDGGVTIDDLLYYLDRYTGGC